MRESPDFRIRRFYFISDAQPFRVDATCRVFSCLVEILENAKNQTVTGYLFFIAKRKLPKFVFLKKLIVQALG
jgi:hypothetical protein